LTFDYRDRHRGCYCSHLQLGNAHLKRISLKLVLTCSRLVPIASIVTPAALSIQTARVQPDPLHPRPVPNLDFRSLSFVGDMPRHSIPSQNSISLAKYNYEAPNQAVLSVTHRLDGRREDSPDRSSGTQLIVDFELRGPSLQCDEVSEEVHYNWTQNIFDYVNIQENCSMIYGYLAWYPGSGGSHGEVTEGLPFLASDPSGSLDFSQGVLTTVVNSSVEQDATFNIVVLPSLAEVWKSDPPISPCYQSARYPNMDMSMSV
jgi:hypothetical protein